MTHADPRIALLHGYLGAQRRHVLGILDGLDDAALRRPVLPSGWSALGMVHHLAVDDERFWFRAVMAGDAEVIASLDSDAWTVPPDVPAEQVLDRYRSEIARSDEVIASLSADAAPTWWPDFFGDVRLDDLADVMMHVIVETATHAGHLDAVRELLDGRQWMVLDS